MTSEPRRRGNQRDDRASGPRRDASKGGPTPGRGRGGSAAGRDGSAGSGGRSGSAGRGGKPGGGGRDEGPRSIEKPEQTFGKNARGSKWGGVARRGAHNASVAARGWGDDPEPGEAPDRSGEGRWVREDRAARQPRKRSNRSTLDLPEIADVHLRGLPQEQRDRIRRRLRDAAEAYLADRFGDADRLLSVLAKRHPQIPEVQELYGLNLYRLGKWKPALHALEMFVDMTGDVDQLPVQADCHRALGNHVEVRRLWDELRQAGPDAPIMVEGRIVMAGSLADQDDVVGAIRLLEQGPVRAKHAQDHHLRLWYTLADLYERAGDHQRARRGFERIEQSEPDYVDVRERLEALA